MNIKQPVVGIVSCKSSSKFTNPSNKLIHFYTEFFPTKDPINANTLEAQITLLFSSKSKLGRNKGIKRDGKYLLSNFIAFITVWKVYKKEASAPLKLMCW